MKTNRIIWSLAVILVLIALYVTKNYNKNDNKNTLNNTPTNNQVTDFANAPDTATGPAIDFTLEDLDGNKVSLSDYKGKKNVFVNFWATWCPPCRQEMPEIEKIYQEYKNKDLVILAVDIGEDKNTVSKFINENKYNFKVLLDSDGSVAKAYNTTSIPVSYFIDKNGNIKAKRIGAMTEEQMKSYVKQLDIK